MATSAATCAPTSKLSSFGGSFDGKTVFVTGHTGFKGAWLCEWLLALGAKVVGYSLPPNTTPSLFEQLNLKCRVTHIEGNILEPEKLKRALAEAGPDFVFHLAAQPIVRRSYKEPLETLATNVMGTAHVLDALRNLQKPCAAICITTDKCYENREWHYGYREEDPLGGHDPYSASKAAAELVISSYRRSFFQQHPVKIASARAGNVIGGGDWAADRLVPDCIRALAANQPVAVRNPQATRPWQHVLEPLSGYLWLAARLSDPSTSTPKLASAFNFGPGHEANRTVAQFLEEVLRHWPGRWEDRSDPKAVHEAGLLQLSSDKASALLRWQPVWNFSDSVRETARWYRQVEESRDAALPARISREQIAAYTQRAVDLQRAWAKTTAFKQ